MIAFGSYNGSYRGCTVEEGVLQWLKLGGPGAQLKETSVCCMTAGGASDVEAPNIPMSTDYDLFDSNLAEVPWASLHSCIVASENPHRILLVGLQAVIAIDDPSMTGFKQSKGDGHFRGKPGSERSWMRNIP